MKALIFDFDGLILDTELTDYLSWRDTYTAYGCELPLDLWTQNIGSVDQFNPYIHLETLLGYPVDRESVKRQRRQRDEALLAEQVVLPGVEAYLAQARELGLRVALASSSRHTWVDTHLQRLGLLAQFDLIVCRDDVENRAKPDPAVYREAVTRLEIAAAEGLALEDSAHGVTAAKRAGLWCTAVPNQMTCHLNFDHADRRLNSLTDMPLAQLIAEIENA